MKLTHSANMRIEELDLEEIVRGDFVQMEYRTELQICDSYVYFELIREDLSRVHVDLHCAKIVKGMDGAIEPVSGFHFTYSPRHSFANFMVGDCEFKVEMANRRPEIVHHHKGEGLCYSINDGERTISGTSVNVTNQKNPMVTIIAIC